MPKLLIFAPCQKVIVGQDSATSLISITEGFVIDVQESVPKDAALPMTWSILTLWHKEGESEENRIYEQRIESELAGAEKKAVDVTQEFVISKEFRNTRNVVEIQGFPIGLPGELVLKLSLREKGQEDWLPIAEFPLEIVYGRQEENS